jgi:hypothetical protein
VLLERSVRESLYFPSRLLLSVSVEFILFVACAGVSKVAAPLVCVILFQCAFAFSSRSLLPPPLCGFPELAMARFLALTLLAGHAAAFEVPTAALTRRSTATQPTPLNIASNSRRGVLQQAVVATGVLLAQPLTATAAEKIPRPKISLKEQLYGILRVQESTAQEARLIKCGAHSCALAPPPAPI